MQLELRLYVDGDGWMLKSNDPQVRELFGTDTLPTPFLASVPASLVLDTIERLNPGAIVHTHLAGVGVWATTRAPGQDVQL